MFRPFLKVSLFLILGLSLGSIQTVDAQRIVVDDEWCDDDSGNRDSERYCEVREYTLDVRELIAIDAAPNGGIQVEGWNRNEISLRAKVTAWSRQGDPQEIVNDIDLETGRVITAHGPKAENREGWAVSFRLMVPQDSDLELESMNGGIRIEGVHGDMDFETMNGGITLRDVGGNVRGRTTNGGLNVSLAGSQWQGEGLDLQTTNGGIVFSVPEDFRARLETGTVNGGFDTEFPITLRGRLRARRFTTDLNGGGPPIRLVTTNGGVQIRAR
jgi:hypothetical protein